MSFGRKGPCVTHLGYKSLQWAGERVPQASLNGLKVRGVAVKTAAARNASERSKCEEEKCPTAKRVKFNLKSN